jgi:hypothetical protein
MSANDIVSTNSISFSTFFSPYTLYDVWIVPIYLKHRGVGVREEDKEFNLVVRQIPKPRRVAVGFRLSLMTAEKGMDVALYI